MRSQTYHQTNLATKVIKGDYLDHDNVIWTYECCVSVSSCGEINAVNINFIEGYDPDENPVLPTEDVVDHVSELAAERALENLESGDFDSDED